MWRRVAKELGRVDILVNNAGTNIRKLPQDLSTEEWRTVIDVNLTSAFLCSKAVFPHLKKAGGGKILNNGSMMSLFALPMVPAYAASKGAVIAMTYIAASQLGRHDINVNAICPGSTLTAMAESTMAGRAEAMGVPVSELQARRADNIPIGRANDPEDIAAMAVFLAGQGARNITGQTFNVDGGLVMH